MRPSERPNARPTAQPPDRAIACLPRRSATRGRPMPSGMSVSAMGPPAVIDEFVVAISEWLFGDWQHCSAVPARIWTPRAQGVEGRRIQVISTSGRRSQPPRMGIDHSHVGRPSHASRSSLVPRESDLPCTPFVNGPRRRKVARLFVGARCSVASRWARRRSCSLPRACSCPCPPWFCCPGIAVVRYWFSAGTLWHRYCIGVGNGTIPCMQRHCLGLVPRL